MNDTISREEILRMIRKHVAETLEGMEEISIDETRSLVDYGASSIDVVEIVSCSMRELRVKVPRQELLLLDTVGELADLFYRYVLERDRRGDIKA
jgi:acyl carrier protein